MVGIFSRFSVNKNGHRRTQSALDERKALPSNSEAAGATIVAGAVIAAAHGIEVAIEFKPLEHPTEPLDNDLPIQCPLPEPSILNDGRIWKERVSAGARRRSNLPPMQEGTPIESEDVVKEPRPPSNRMILPSISAPEHNILKLLEECNVSSI
ncbi:Inter-alpha-trypsin inhibitor heavy chain like [Actinidia chinensis var. chinensis]|uniref:Inter-alpha-trypsin inhibitor heavy chain like n=1 Tax=Actinidia chinensis var. chinensis TaxID=1590841 RepID=A0A2R6R220_ACTCC|nr:Inter-alpha-trypsin inhibitor heavy chain like [Actinidia chinensis var. chinensis]